MALRSGQGQRKKYLTMDLSNLSTFVRNLRAVVSEFQFAKIGAFYTTSSAPLPEFSLPPLTSVDPPVRSPGPGCQRRIRARGAGVPHGRNALTPRCLRQTPAAPASAWLPGRGHVNV